MLRRVVLLVVLAPGVASADEPLPPGAVARLGDTRFLAGGPVERLDFSADAKHLTAVTKSALASRTPPTTWNTLTWTPTRTPEEVLQATAVVRVKPNTLPDGRGVVIDDGVAVVRDFETGKDVARLTGHFAKVTATVVSPDGRRIATGSADGLVRVWDSTTFRPLVEPRGHRGEVLSVSVSPDGKLALTSGADGAVIVWDVAAGREVRAFAAAVDAEATFTTDGTAVRFRQPKGFTTRDIATGLEVEKPDARSLTASDATISPDGRTRVISDESGDVWLVEVATGETRRKLSGHRAACRAFAFTPDGTKLLTASADHSVLVWAVRLQDTPLSAALKKETSAAKLWATMASKTASEAYAAMARMAADPRAAVAMARLRMKTKADEITDVRAVELLEAVGTVEARAFLKELASADPPTPRFREASAALERLGGVR
ncbi:MAG TPA: hypothetical protein VMZ71_06695 [Gemmataceae bacterium]|nr:hypothetical protein [Gemmataceae bacterium]